MCINFSLFKEVLQVGDHSAARDTIHLQACHPEVSEDDLLFHANTETVANVLKQISLVEPTLLCQVVPCHSETS